MKRKLDYNKKSMVRYAILCPFLLLLQITGTERLYDCTLIDSINSSCKDHLPQDIYHTEQCMFCSFFNLYTHMSNKCSIL